MVPAVFGDSDCAKEKAELDTRKRLRSLKLGAGLELAEVCDPLISTTGYRLDLRKVLSFSSGGPSPDGHMHPGNLDATQNLSFQWHLL